ncbi:MAG TPA: class I SAM-dependent methyltransferase [Terrimesophilobacter sp.]|nr:class I SAM-dependent methyltransferase [Terrimesophilobacter sp.]
MEKSELVQLLSPEGLRLLDELPDYGEVTDVVGAVSRLRAAGHAPALVAAVMSQSRLRRRARNKFGEFAERMLFTEAGLEQSTRLTVAALHARRFQDAGCRSVADLGCGIGGDALAFAALGLVVTAVERDEVTAAVASFNLAPWDNARVVHGDAENFDVSDADGVFLDPARRTASKRLSNPADWSPSLGFAFGLGERMPTGVKLGPGIDRGLIPENAEAQWVSMGGDVVELGVWMGAVARPGIRRAALVIGERDGATSSAELTAAADSDDAPVGELGEFVYEPDGAVIRARLIGDLARRLGATMLSEDIAWLSSETRVDTPFAARFRVIESLPFDVRALKRLVAARGLGTLEIKKRGVDVDPAQLRAKLAPKGPNSATLIVTRVAGQRTVLLAERD